MQHNTKQSVLQILTALLSGNPAFRSDETLMAVKLLGRDAAMQHLKPTSFPKISLSVFQNSSVLISVKVNIKILQILNSQSLFLPRYWSIKISFEARYINDALYLDLTMFLNQPQALLNYKKKCLTFPVLSSSVLL